MYIGEGHKRCRNQVGLANSDPRVIDLAAYWIRRLARNRVTYQVQHHADQDPGELAQFWSARLGVEPSEVRLVRKSNSGQLRSRTWRCVHGVMSVRANDTHLRARLQAWMDLVTERWLSFVTF